MTLIETYKGLIGRDPSEEEMDNLRRIAKAGGFKENDAIWTLFVALEHYQTLYKEAPARIKDAVEGAIAAVKEGSDAHAKEAMAKAHTALAEAVSKAAKEVASKSAGRDYAKWLTGAICAAVIALSAVGGGAYYLGHHIATSAAQDRGEWIETAEGRDAAEKQIVELDKRNAEFADKVMKQDAQIKDAVTRAEAAEAGEKRLQEELTAANEQGAQMKAERDAAMVDLAKCREEMSELSKRKDKTEADTKAEISNIHRVTREQMEAVRSESKTEIEAMRDDLKAHHERAERLTEDLVASTDRAARAEEKIIAQTAEINRLATESKAVQKPAKTA